ncbi:class I SAM-dependent methyltransferase [Desulfobacula sp.]|uniref:class I SAM-dependent methyltransferase n=1 Tax=Desulfobacula sp. TaxID=2593537 RepID=UPI0026222702|nr:class I SAM-dependent methyltransferase [Desulfobacula sp.]
MITIDFHRLDIRPNDRILDIGCGEGRHTIKACQHEGTRCVGGDFGFENLVVTKKKLAFHEALADLGCRCIDLSCMDVTCLPFKNNSFDAVICSEVLEHIPADKIAMSELVRILKPGRILAVSVPRFLPEKLCWLLSDTYGNCDGGHVRIYTEKTLIRDIEAFGVTHFAGHYAHSIHSPFWWLKCLVGPDRTDSKLVNLYHRILVWDLMKKPKLTAFIDDLLNPILGKSLVLYFKKP